MTNKPFVAWLGFRYAAERVERTLGCTWGRAQKLLLEACETGEIRYQKNYNGPDVADSDFYRWLDKLQHNKPAKRSSKQSERAQLAINALWHGAVPEALSNPEIVVQVGKWLTGNFKQHT